MIPTVVFVGLVAGLAVGTRARLVPLVAGGVVAALGFGLVVADEGQFLGGTLLAVPNYAAGAAIGVVVRWLVTSASRSGHRRDAAGGRVPPP